jgi:nitroreductase
MADILDVISSRKSIRNYKADPIPQDMIMKILEAGRWAPTGENLQPWKVIVVKDPDTKAAIARLSKIGTGSRGTAEYSMNLLQRFDGMRPEDKERALKFYATGEVSEFPSKAPAVIVAIGDLTVDSPDVPYDVSAMMENMILEAHSLGLGACWIHGPVANIRHAIELKRILRIPAGMGQYKVLAVMSVGWPLEQRRHSRPKKPLEDIVYWEEFGRKEPS